MDFRVRELNLNDLDSIGELHSLVEGLHREALPSRFRKPPADFLKSLLNEAVTDDRAKFLVADSSDGLLGYVRIMIKEMPHHALLNPGNFISVEELVVKPTARRLGVGKELMSAAEKFAGDLGFTEIELNVWKFNDTAEKFYVDLGYLPVRTFFAKKIAK